MADALREMSMFVAVCETESFSGAARRLRISASVVSRRISEMEARLGVRLLQRSTRSVGLTEPGARYLARARRILADVEEAEHAVQNEQSEPRGRLVVSAPLVFGRLRVAPIVSEYLSRHRLARAQLELSDRNANLVDDAIDVAIRIGRLADSDLIARKLGETRRLLVASPDYLAAHGAPSHPNDLRELDLIAFDPLTPRVEWSFEVGAQEMRIRTEPRLITNVADVAIRHALGGGGITAAFCYQVAEPLQTGALVEVLADLAPDPAPIQAVYSSSRLMSAKVRAFLDLAEAAARTWPTPWLRRPGPPGP